MDIFIGIWLPLIVLAVWVWYWFVYKLNKVSEYIKDGAIISDKISQYAVSTSYNPFAVYVINTECFGKIGTRFFDFNVGDIIDITRYEYEHTPLGQKVEVVK